MLLSLQNAQRHGEVEEVSICRESFVNISIFRGYVTISGARVTDVIVRSAFRRVVTHFQISLEASATCENEFALSAREDASQKVIRVYADSNRGSEVPNLV